MKSWAYVLFFSIFCLNLSGCLWSQNDPRVVRSTDRAACNLLKSRIIFNGATYDNRQSQIEKAETPLDQHAYDSHCE
jgi:hypothetical protein